MLSIIVPCFNEESSLPLFFEETEKVKDQVGMPFEYLFINDGSSDQTLAVMRKRCIKSIQKVCGTFRFHVILEKKQPCMLA